MFLLADIGNTSILLALFKSGKIRYPLRIKTDKSKKTLYYKKILRDYFKKYKVDTRKIESAIFCSVVPSLNTVFRKALEDVLSCYVYEAGRDLEFPVKNKYKNPKQVGADRLANAAAACHDYPKKNIIIIDFGTATTFDLVNKKGEYLGGLITPGINTSLKALSKEAELLPEINLNKVKGILGKDTLTSMRNGIMYATAFACEGIVKSLKKVFYKDARVLATGGHLNLIKRYTTVIDKADPYLTIRGLYIAYIKKQRK